MCQGIKIALIGKPPNTGLFDSITSDNKLRSQTSMRKRKTPPGGVRIKKQSKKSELLATKNPTFQRY
jgi:hypothetical protein